MKDTLFIDGNGAYPVYKHLYIFKTDSNFSPAFIYDSVKPQQFFKLYPRKSYFENMTVSRHYWLTFTVKNNLPHDGVFYYQFNSFAIDMVQGYRKISDSGFLFIGATGGDIPFSKRIYPYYDATYQLALAKGETATFLLCVSNAHGDNISFLPELKDAASFRSVELKFYIVTAIMCGIMLLVFVLNIFFGIALKERLHFLYAFYILIALNEILTMQRVDFQYIFFDDPDIINPFYSINPCLLTILMAHVMQSFLKQKRSNSRVKIFVDIGVIFTYILIAVCCLLYWKFSDKWAIFGIYEIVMCISFLVMFFLLLLSAIEKVIQGYKPAWFYLVATALFSTGLIQYIMLALGGYNADTVGKDYPNTIQIGIVLESIIVFMGIVYRYNLYKKEREQLLVEVNQQQQNLINKIIDAEEGERKRIAEDLHDDVGSTLSMLAMQLSYARQSMEQSPVLKRQFDQSLALSKKAVNDIRNIAHNLLPKDFAETGIFATLETRIQELNATGNIFFRLIIEGNDKKLKEVIAISVYRIINELLTNITRHSEASEATVQLLLEENMVQVMIEDNGKGFDTAVKEEGIGLKNVSRRIETLKGIIHIESNREGTNIIIQIPYNNG